jgi:hydrogenase maturation protein HypF
VFENQHLLNKMVSSLKDKGFEVFYNKQVPINDGGISFGQLHAASAIMEERDVSCSTS